MPNVEDQGRPSEAREPQAQLVAVPWIVVFGVLLAKHLNFARVTLNGRLLYTEMPCIV